MPGSVLRKEMLLRWSDRGSTPMSCASGLCVLCSSRSVGYERNANSPCLRSPPTVLGKVDSGAAAFDYAISLN